MLARVNTTGTHVHKGLLRVRVDLFPRPGTALHALHYVDHPNREYTPEEIEDEALRAMVPTHKELNPCLCHFLTVAENITPAELEALIRETFNRKTMKTLDDALLREDSKNRVPRIMRNKKGRGRPVQTFGKNPRAAMLDAVNARLKGVEVSV